MGGEGEEGKERGEKGEYQNVYHIGDGEGGCNGYNGMISVQKFKKTTDNSSISSYVWNTRKPSRQNVVDEVIRNNS